MPAKTYDGFTEEERAAMKELTRADGERVVVLATQAVS
jgi:hypothetical protein